jgi:hypothetical protein
MPKKSANENRKHLRPLLFRHLIFQKSDKRAKKPEKSVERGVVKHKESNLKVI